jgi:hypothetical protein
MVPLYIACMALLMLASAFWRYWQRNMLGMAACLLMGRWS